jgi:hypothetical protein
MKRSRRWIIAIAVVVLLAAAALWYTRPLTLTELLGAEPARIHMVISRFDQAGGSQTRELNADWDQAPEATALAEELTVRRSLLNPLRSLLNPVQFGTPTQAGDYNYLLSLTGREGDRVTLQWFVDQWSYETPGTSRYLPCSVSASRSGGELGDALWELSQPVESNS